MVRFPYRNGDLKATGPGETVISGLPTGGHTTRDLVFSKDGQRMFVAVGSAKSTIPTRTPREHSRQHFGVHARRTVRADLRGRNPQSRGLAVNPTTGEVWCSVNERDELGDNLVPDYITHVFRGGFYGWP